MNNIDSVKHEQDISSDIYSNMTIEEFLENDVEGFEFVKGELVEMSPASRRHGRISINIIRYLDPVVYDNNLGELYTAETSFKVGERVLKPDVAYVSYERLIGDDDKGLPIPPELAIEVVSPTDVQAHVVQKAFAYLSEGTQCVWVLDPETKTVTVYKSETDIKILTSEETLTGDDVVPGFSCQVEKLFE